MKKLSILTGVIALASAFGFVGASLADAPSSGFHSHGEVAAPIIDFDVGDGASCVDGQRDALKTDKLDAVADRGYFKGAEILACDEDGILVTLTRSSLAGPRSSTMA